MRGGGGPKVGLELRTVGEGFEMCAGFKLFRAAVGGSR